MANNYERNVNVTTVTESDYKGSPMLSIPTSNPKYPVTMGVKKWAEVIKHVKAIEAFVAKHNIVTDTEEAALAALGITAEELAMLRAGK